MKSKIKLYRRAIVPVCLPLLKSYSCKDRFDDFNQINEFFISARSGGKML